MAPIAALQLGLVGRAHLDAGTAERIEAIEQHGAYPHLLFKLRRLPSFGPPFEHLNADPRTRFNTILVPDPELQQASYEACRRGEVPQHPPVGMQIPTVMDPSLAPERAIFSSDHFAAMQGATNGDFTHGLIHPSR